MSLTRQKQEEQRMVALIETVRAKLIEVRKMGIELREKIERSDPASGK